ncbi:MAG TPA: cytochrome P450 [Acidimicrobiales bacterium]|nr:cytochrome P450 [Acidimicrobiales bacterium]
MTTVVHELELPTLDVTGMERSAALSSVSAARNRHWLARAPLGYSVTRYEDAVAVLRDRRFHSAVSLIPELAGLTPTDRVEERRRRSILSMEGDEHARLRRLVAPAFTPASADRLRPYMREVIGELADAVCAAGRCELVAEVCEWYPIPVICELLGAPKEDIELFSAWATDIFRIFNQNLVNDQPLIAAAMSELGEYVSAMVAERRARPRADLLSDLIAAEEAGDRLSSDELVMMVQAILMAGTDTTRNQLACSMALFAEHPQQWALLAANPQLAPRAVEESMRYLGAVRGTSRVASEDISYRGVLFPRGTLVFVTLVGVNRDPGTFDSPDIFDISTEREAAQMTFGSGIHHCLGAALARAELQEALAELSRRMPGLSLDGPVEWKPTTFGIWGPARLPVRFDRSSPAK